MCVLRKLDVCEKNTPPEKKTCGTISFESAESAAGERLPLPDRTLENQP